MCVAITLEPGASLSEEEIERMDRSNADGVGVAWVDQGLVHWSKTLHVNVPMVKQLIDHFKGSPRLVHFRFSTAGGTQVGLCHPFEIGPMANCNKSGTGQKVLIHNGHWGRWNEVHGILESENLLPDKWPWSDSRLVAFLAHTDPDWITAAGGKIATLDAAGKIERHGLWEDLRDGVKVSNKSWDTSCGVRRGGYSGYKNWQGWKDPDKDATEAPEEESKGKGKGSNGKGTGKAASSNGSQSHPVVNGKSTTPFAGRDGRSYVYNPETNTVVEIAPHSGDGEEG